MSQSSIKSASATPKGKAKRGKQITGALPTTPSESVASITETPTSAEAKLPSMRLKHQTHGGYTPISGPITNVDQIRRRPNSIKGAPGAFASVHEYAEYLHTLNTADLHRHCVEQARIVPIDDRGRLIRRLEDNWSSIVAKEGLLKAPPARPQFTAEQRAKQDEIGRQLLRR